jgi:hypothetical protein
MTRAKVLTGMILLRISVACLGREKVKRELDRWMSELRRKQFQDAPEEVLRELRRQGLYL